MSTPLKIWFERDGKLLRLRLARPKANIVDAEMIAALDGALAEHVSNSGLLAVLLDAEGPHFSFGASVEEHMPENCTAMLQALHGLILRMAHSEIPIIACVGGQCLGGGLEVAMAAHMMFVADDAKLGQPEIRLGVFAPAASCLLPEKIGPARAFDLLVSGRSISAADAASWGLANDCSEDPETAALAWFDDHIAGLSGASLRQAVSAAHGALADRLEARLKEVERQYLEDLMATHDAVEGLTAFVEKRSVKWENR